MQPTEIAGCVISGIAGSGGFATTYAASHPDWGDVAVKVLSANWTHNADVARRFVVECETLEMAHAATSPEVPAHVPAYFAHGVHSGAPYLVTEFCAGGSLEQRLAGMPEEDRLPVCLWVIRSALSGLAFIHDELGVIHRDLSPGNLLLRSGSGGADTLLLADFGMLKHTALQTNLSHVMGTAGYAAPEVRSLGVCDARSDVYSLGVIGWEILTGEQADITTRFTRESFQSNTPESVVDLVLAMVHVDREQRPFVAEAVQMLNSVETPRAAMPAPLTESFVTPMPVDDQATGRAVSKRRSLTVLAGLVAAGALAAIGVFMLTNEPHFFTHVPDGRGLVVELTSEWIADEPTDQPVFFTAANSERSMALGVGSLGASDVTAAIELVAESLEPDAETLGSDVLENGNGSLRYRRGDGSEDQIFFAERSCGTLMMTITNEDGFSTDDLDHVAEIGERFRTIDQPVLPDREVPAPDGFTTFSLNGVALAAPDSYYRIDSPGHCLFVIDDTPEHTRSIAINYYAAADPDAIGDLLLGLFEDQGADLIEEETTADGFPRRYFANDVSEFVVYLVSDGAGVYTVQMSEFLELPYESADHLTFDQVMTTFRVVP